MKLTESKKEWAIFRLKHGKKWWATRYNPSMKEPDQYMADVNYASPEVVKFDHDTAIRIIQKAIRTSEKYGIVNSKGLQKPFDWRVKYPDKYDDVDTLIKKEIMKPIKLKDLLKEEAESLFGMKPTVTEPDRNGSGRYEYNINRFSIDITYRLDATYPFKLSIYSKDGFVEGYGLKPFKSKEDMHKEIKKILPKLKSGKVDITPFKQ